MGRKSALSLALLIAFCGARCSKKVDDARLTTEIKAKMFSDPQLNGANLDVTSKNGQITLAGAVPNDAARYKAYKLANETAGVTKVNDEMRVAAVSATALEATPLENPAASAASSSNTTAAPKPTLEKSRKASERKSAQPPEDDAAEKNAAPQPQPEPAPAAPVVAPAPAPPAPLQSAPVAPPPPGPKQVAVPANSTLTVRMIDGVDSSVNNAGEIFHASLESPVVVDNQVVVPRGADVYVRLVNAKSAGKIKGKSELDLELVKMEFQGRSYPLVSSTYSLTGGSRGKNTAAKVGGGAALGAIIGGIAGGGKGAGIGAGVGAAGGAIYQGATKGKQVKIPAETKLDFQLEQPVTVTVMPRPSNFLVGQQ